MQLGTDMGNLHDNPDLLLAGNDPDEPVVSIELSGSGLAPRICPEVPFLVDFGSIQVNTTAERSYQFTSCGSTSPR